MKFFLLTIVALFPLSRANSIQIQQGGYAHAIASAVNRLFRTIGITKSTYDPVLDWAVDKFGQNGDDTESVVATMIERYTGDWKAGRKDGAGTTYYTDGSVKYEGEFQSGIFHGVGTF